MSDPVLVLIGGCEDLEGEKEILRELVALAGGRKARIVTLTAATTRPEKTAEQYGKAFRSLGVTRHVAGLDRNDRFVAHELLQKIEEATCIFFAGGDQVRAVSHIVASQLHEVLSRKCHEGVVMAGTSAGAVLMAETMVTGRQSEAVPRPGAVQLKPGIGLIQGVIIDTHFSQRGRFGRLAVSVARQPLCLGIGIDENTAVVSHGNKGEVVGEGTVTLIDGKNILYSDLNDGRTDRPVSVTGLVVHIIASQHTFRFEERVVTVAAKT